MELKRLIGAKIIKINDDIDNVFCCPSLLSIKTSKGTLKFSHNDFMGNVWLEDGLEDLEKMIGETILHAEVIENYNEDRLDECDESYTWTYYKISTLNHDCTLRFYGTSNGYYSEDVEVEWEE